MVYLNTFYYFVRVYQFITNLFLVTNIPTPEFNTIYRRISHPVAFVVGQLAFWRGTHQ